jgi:Protein of unknown function (DUF1580)
MTATFSQEKKVLICMIAREFQSHRTGRTIGTEAVCRWIQKGVRGPNGNIVKLEAVRIAGRFYSSREALQRFIDAQQDATASALPEPARSAGKRMKASERAEQELAAARI